MFSLGVIDVKGMYIYRWKESNQKSNERVGMLEMSKQDDLFLNCVC